MKKNTSYTYFTGLMAIVGIGIYGSLLAYKPKAVLTGSINTIAGYCIGSLINRRIGRTHGYLEGYMTRENNLPIRLNKGKKKDISEIQGWMYQEELTEIYVKKFFSIRELLEKKRSLNSSEIHQMRWLMEECQDIPRNLEESVGKRAALLSNEEISSIVETWEDFVIGCRGYK